MSFAALIAAADRAVLSHLGGVAIEYQPEGGVPVTVQGIFDPAHVLADQGGSGVETVRPAVWLRLADLPTDPIETNPTIIVGGVRYNVLERRADGQVGGSVVLVLQRTAY